MSFRNFDFYYMKYSCIPNGSKMRKMISPLSPVAIPFLSTHVWYLFWTSREEATKKKIWAPRVPKRHSFKTQDSYDCATHHFFCYYFNSQYYIIKCPFRGLYVVFLSTHFKVFNMIYNSRLDILSFLIFCPQWNFIYRLNCMLSLVIHWVRQLSNTFQFL